MVIGESTPRKRYIFYKYLPFVTKRRIIQKPVACGSESDGDETMTYVALHITYEDAHINNDTFHVRYTLTKETEDPYTYHLPTFQVVHEPENYKKLIKDHLLNEFGIKGQQIAKVQYKNQHVHEERYYVNVYRVQLNSMHRHFPSPYARFKEPVKYVNKDPATDEIVCIENKFSSFHKYQWVWKMNCYTLPCTWDVMEIYEEIIKNMNIRRRNKNMSEPIPSQDEDSNTCDRDRDCDRDSDQNHVWNEYISKLKSSGNVVSTKMQKTKHCGIACIASIGKTASLQVHLPLSL
jgi:hypothetical protein